jgi:tetratricopeptide (TPR) repeat protein
MSARNPGQAESERQVRAALEAAIRRFADSDPFTALGLDRRADEAALKTRYQALVGQYHPHHYARHPAVVVSLATDAFVQMQRAHRRCQELFDSRKLGGKPKDEARQLAAATDPARLAVSEARRLLEHSQFTAAAEVLERALRDDPDNAKLGVWRFTVQARACRAAEDPSGALAAYEEILELAPGNQEALDAVASLRARLDAPKGLLDRLLGGGKK